MKNFMTKLISTAAALAMAASMSVYAEESVQASTALSTGEEEIFSIDARACSHSSTTETGPQYVDTKTSSHWVGGKKCMIITDILEYKTVCRNCGAVLRSRREEHTTHTLSHV